MKQIYEVISQTCVSRSWLGCTTALLPGQSLPDRSPSSITTLVGNRAGINTAALAWSAQEAMHPHFPGPRLLLFAVTEEPWAGGGGRDTPGLKEFVLWLGISSWRVTCWGKGAISPCSLVLQHLSCPTRSWGPLFCRTDVPLDMPLGPQIIQKGCTARAVVSVRGSRLTGIMPVHGPQQGQWEELRR